MQPFRVAAVAAVCAAALAAVAVPQLTRAVESRVLAVAPPLRARHRGQVDVAVVLGFALERDGAPTKALRRRVSAGVALFEEGLAGALVFTGGHPGDGLHRRGNRSEAEIMKECGLDLLEQDLLESAEQNWILEDESTSTRENALFTLRKLWAHPLCAGASPGASDPITVAIVTSPFHQRRSLLTFERAYRDLTAQASEVRPSSRSAPRLTDALTSSPDPCLPPLPPRQPLREMRFQVASVKHEEEDHLTISVLREGAAIFYYKVRGWL